MKLSYQGLFAVFFLSFVLGLAGCQQKGTAEKASDPASSSLIDRNDLGRRTFKQTKFREEHCNEIRHEGRSRRQVASSEG